MTISDIPVRVVGPGSQDVGDKALSYLSMPSDMSTYVQPYIADLERIRQTAGARETMAWLRQALADCGESAAPACVNLATLDEASREIVNQILGEGEVSVTYSGTVEARTQESVLAGVWRTFCFDDAGNAVADLIEVGDVPRLVRSQEHRERPVDTGAEGVPEGMTNALSILVELEAHLDDYRKNGTAEIINLSLLPLSEQEVEFLDRRLGRGPVDILSRAYGKCQIISTRSPNVWWVRYYNSMSNLILNTLEVVDVPQVVRAAPEDLRDSASRLDEILKPYELDGA